MIHEHLSFQRLTWNTATPPSIFDGRILRLDTKHCKFKYGHSTVINNPCFVFKISGKLQFPLPSKTTSVITTIKPSASTSLLYSSTTQLLSTLPTVSPSITQVQPTQGVTSSHVGTFTKVSMVTTTPRPSSTPPVVISRGHKDEQSGAPVGAIVGPLAGILIIIGIAVILIFLWKRRQRKATRKNDKIGNGQNHKDNPTYGKNETIDLSKQNRGPKITGNELEYDYAAVDGDPRASNGAAPRIYQSLIKDPNRESVYTPLERQEANQYNKVERAPFKPARNGPTDPTYNVLERPSDNNDDYLEPGSHIDKNKRPPSKPAPQNNEPVYNVLEGPNQEGEDEPEYNVLEDPDAQDDPEYNVLEDPDDNYDNTPVETDRGHPSSHDNVGYASTIDFKKRQGTKNEPVYEAPEGPSSELTYQPLQINGQDNVYQPLDRTSRMIPDDQPVYHVLESQGSEA
ncbi:uncharacterized protein LOC110251129 isoform X2 [Exaiptasia diaphana]|uniref:Uncharacterized protein n=1 Tax=Exaiptasia diaphana TaxID=2652724 RepID=A0A913Y124_EXADI|nr:uncharacterized protein LOC110251129 isoform X2 [Exaiptasia diaphana]